MSKLGWWFAHLALFAVGQGLLLAAGASWPVAFLNGSVPGSLTLFSDPAMWISRVWCIVFAVDTVWSWSYAILPKGKR
jgi:DHA1 family multidrug resistance protein-like MFS transporter